MAVKYQNCALALEECQQHPLPGLGALAGHTRSSGPEAAFFLTAHVHAYCFGQNKNDKVGKPGGHGDWAANV